MAEAQSHPASLIEQLQSILGSENVRTDDYSCTLYAQDVYAKEMPAFAVLQPHSSSALAAAVSAITAAGNAVIARGGGMSYTRGYVPVEENSFIIDMQYMDKVLEINADDMYVTVEAGCTWKSLHEALAGTGLRTPYWGTLSGIHATVGGSLSQNSIFWGSGRHGTAADSVVSLDVILADGSVITTGANSRTNGSPFFRHYGPDLTGIFTADAGALGIKVSATLRLLPAVEHREQLSFDFDDYPQLVAAMSDISRAGLADECFAFDPYLQAIRMERESMLSDVKKLAGVLKSAGSVMGAIKDGAKVAIAGRRFMDDVNYSLHVMIEERVAASARAAANDVREICDSHRGREIENSIPKILRANPFTPLNNMVGPNGERWVPVHTIVPHSKAETTLNAVMDLFARNQSQMDEFGIGVGFLLATVSNNGFVLEPVFFTPDSLNELHKETVEAAALKRMSGFASNPAAAAVTTRLRKELIEVFMEAGGIHMQIGKSYPYRQGLREESWRLVRDIKQAVDPNNRINPGALGME